jgi:hypothetical protein
MRTDDSAEGEQLASKKAYAPPKLTEYGSVAKLTEAQVGSVSDGGGIGKLSGGGPRRR